MEIRVAKLPQFRTHKKSVEAARGNLSPDEVSRRKNAERKARNDARRQHNGVMMFNRSLPANKRSPKDQLAELDFRLGKDEGASRERKKLKALIG